MQHVAPSLKKEYSYTSMGGGRRGAGAGGGGGGGGGAGGGGGGGGPPHRQALNFSPPVRLSAIDGETDLL
jgi:hypothetical protein